MNVIKPYLVSAGLKAAKFVAKIGTYYAHWYLSYKPTQGEKDKWEVEALQATLKTDLEEIDN